MMNVKRNKCKRFLYILYFLVLLCVVIFLLQLSLVRWVSKEKTRRTNRKLQNQLLKVLRLQAELSKSILSSSSKNTTTSKESIKTATSKSTITTVILKNYSTSTSKQSNLHKKTKLAPALSRPPNYVPNGPGEFGREFILENLTSKEMKEAVKLLAKYDINLFISDRISLHRTVEDHRPLTCKDENEYSYENFSSASVIIAFRNEAMSTLLRTVYSVLHNTPNILLKEIILVDDYGTLGNIVVFLDSHCECTHGWIEPLLESISKDPSVIAVPHFYDIDHFTFEHHYNQPPQMGGFTWELFYRESPLPSFHPSHLPIRTPVFKGGFAANRKFLNRIGGFDTSNFMKCGEDVEFSLRAWMCNAQILIHPCSRVGHVAPVLWWFNDNPKQNRKLRSSFRIAKLHLSEPYYDIFGLYMASYTKKKMFAGRLIEQLKLKRKLKCKDFGWYMKNVYPQKYVPELRKGYIGNLKLNYTKSTIKHCVVCYEDHVKLTSCTSDHSQLFEYSKHGLLRCNEENCLTVDKENKIRVVLCPDATRIPIPENLHWEYDEATKILKFLPSRTCLLYTVQSSYENTKYKIEMKTCDPESDFQRWRFILFPRKSARMFTLSRRNSTI